MVDITSEQIWNEKFEDKKVKKMSFESRIISIGIILFGICTLINSVLIFTFLKIFRQL